MTQFYFNPEREHEPGALPDAEAFYVPEHQSAELDAGWYWHACLPGCLPDSDPVGPFDTVSEAIADAQEV